MAGANVVNVTEQTFRADVLERSKQVPVVVDFWAEWCGPCRMLGPTLEKLAAEGGGAWVLAKVDTDANQDLARRYRIQGIPAVKAFIGGKEVDEFVGALPESQVRSWLAGLGPSEDDEKADALLAEAEALAGRDPDRARALLGEVPAGVRAGRSAEIARISLLADAASAGDPDEARARISSDPADLDARWDLAMVLHARGDTESALAELLEIVRRDRTWRDDGARKKMLELFEVAGPRSPVSDRWRGKLAMVLY